MAGGGGLEGDDAAVIGSDVQDGANASALGSVLVLEKSPPSLSRKNKIHMREAAGAVASDS